jgi:hypothetical protein
LDCNVRQTINLNGAHANPKLGTLELAMTEVQTLARFAERARLRDLSDAGLQQLKIRVLDTIGLAIAALNAPPITAIRRLTFELGGRSLASLIGAVALDAGADIIMIESEGITENVKSWRTDVVASIANRLGLANVMFEGATRRCSNGMSKTTAMRSIFSLIIAKSFSSKLSAPGFGAPRALGAA